MKIAVIVDNGCVQRFALEGLNAIDGTDEISVFNCRNTRLKKNVARHAAYYALNLLTVRNRLTRFVPVTSGTKRIAFTVDFDAEVDGAWQRLPPSIIAALRDFDIVLKFGMGLLRVPSDDELPVPILSYHHGDPARYRGRPAGFWEMRDGTPVMGQVVQVIGNTLDAGQIVAFAETKVFPWSYRATLVEAYRHSPLIINRAIRNARSRTYVQRDRAGRNCRLPSNWTTMAFTTRIAWQFAKRLAYGTLREKAWRVSLGPVDGIELPQPKTWRTLDVAPGYTFYADPFFVADDGAVLVEALNRRTGLGEILKIKDGNQTTVLKARGHASYPATAIIAGREIVVPEIARWSEPRAFDDTTFEEIATLKIAGDPRVLDPTLLEHGGRIYLFGNDREVGSGVLYLWHASSIDEPFVEHPDSPISITPRGSRMGGAIIEQDGRLIRLGQDFSGAYGDGLLTFEIEELSPERYREREIGRLAFTDRKGPHTLNIRNGQAVFDWYRDRLTPLAGVRRLLGKSRS